MAAAKKAETFYRYLYDPSKYKREDIEFWKSNADAPADVLRDAIEQIEALSDNLRQLKPIGIDAINREIDESVRIGLETLASESSMSPSFPHGRFEASFCGENLEVVVAYDFQDVVQEICDIDNGCIAQDANETKEQWAFIFEQAAANIRGSKQ